MLLTEPPLVLDADLLSSFAWVDRLDILVKLYAKKMIVLDEVLDEISKVKYLADKVQQYIDNRSIKLMCLNATDPEAVELAHLRDEGSLGKGEAACMAYLKYNYGTLGSNNLSDIKVRCLEKNICLITTQDVIHRAYEKNLITLEEANEIWSEMIRKRIKLPASSFSDILSASSETQKQK
jgi:predicted nucleic acid-binding protein